ncbi:MAG: ATP-binding protein [Sphaerochaetaceae bacterium]|jgi:predicted AAA+ superfamily ATPase
MEKYLSRLIETQIREVLRMFPVLVLTGVRQAGKTCTLTHLLPQYRYVSLELPSVSAMAEETPELFLASHPVPVIFDEIQNAPNLFRYVKKEVDESRHAMGAFVLSGSQHFSLMQNVSESLAGRAGVLQMEGMCYQETGYASIEEAILRGGYPELARNHEMNVTRFFSSYLLTYLERDVRQLKNVGNLRDFERFMRLLALRSGCQLDMSALATGVGVSLPTIKAWISVLETSCIISFLQPWSGNLSKRLVKSPKVYFNDTGLLCFLQGISEIEELKHSMMIGQIWETFVFSELRKHVAGKGLNRQFFFYRENSGLEVDLLVIGNGTRLIEAKWSEHPGADAAKAIIQLKEKISKAETTSYGLSNVQGYIACRTAAPYPVDPAASRTMAIGGEELGTLV